jgi:tetratricopeptide (TPR) repeat protein
MEAKKTAVDYLEEGDRLLESGTLEEAIAAYRREIELNPDISWSHHNLGEALAKLGQFEEAIAAFRSAIELNPDFSWSYHHLGDALDRQQQWEEAVVAFRRAIELNPEHFGSYCGLGKSLVKLGQLDEAIAAYRRAIELNPDDVQAYRNILEMQPDCVEMQPDRVELLLQLGKALAKQGDLEGAIVCNRRAIEFNPISEENADNENKITAELEQTQLQLQQIDAEIQQAQLRRQQVSLELDRLEYKRHVRQKCYYYNTDWFSHNIPNWQEYLRRFVNLPELNVLEIGSWEGRSTCWLLDNILTHESARITCVDTWQGGVEHQNMKRNVLLSEACFDVNTFLTGHPEKVIKKVGLSCDVMRLLPINSYDVIYVDGSHEAEDVLVDAILAWGLIKIGGLVIFDDYGLGGGVKDAVDVFLKFFGNKLKLIHISFQVYVEKTA